MSENDLKASKQYKEAGEAYAEVFEAELELQRALNDGSPEMEARIARLEDYVTGFRTQTPLAEVRRRRMN